MRSVNKFRLFGLLLFSFSVISSGCSSKSLEARISEDKSAISKVREDIKKAQDFKDLEESNKKLAQDNQRLAEIRTLNEQINKLTKELGDEKTKYKILLEDCVNNRRDSGR